MRTAIRPITCLYSHYIELQLRIPMLLRPKVKRRRGDFVHHRFRMPILCQVHRLDVALAGITTFHSNVIELGCSVDRQLSIIFLSTSGTNYPAELPLGCTERAQQRAPAAIALLAQNAPTRLSVA